jgi:hypothetical protein
LQRALVNFGSVPDFSQLAKSLGMTEADLQNAAGPDIQRLAQENTAAGTSTQARLTQANDDAVRQIRAALNRRGLLNSGESGYQLDRQNTGYRQASYDANQKLLDYLQKYQQGYVSAQQARQGQLAQSYSDAANRQYANNQGTPGTTATFDHVDSAGRAVYRGPDGRLYDVSGSAYSPPATGYSTPNGTGTGPAVDPNTGYGLTGIGAAALAYPTNNPETAATWAKSYGTRMV